MAIGLNSRVRVKLTSAAFLGAAGGRLQPQPPLFGRVTAFTAPDADILTEQGETLKADVLSLDEILPVTPVILETFLYKVVVGLITAANPPAAAVRFGDAYVGRVVDLFIVSATPSALIKSLSNGMYYEMPIFLVDILKDR